MNKKGLALDKILIIVMFFTACLIPVVTVDHTENAISKVENRYLANFPRFFGEDGAWNKNICSEIENWFDDHLGGREALVSLSANIKTRVFRQSSSFKVHIGKEGWYYYTQDENLEIAKGKYTLPVEMLQEILQKHLQIRERLAGKGMEYVIVLPPSKVSVYPEYLRTGSGEVQKTPVDMVADYLEANSDLKVVRLKEDLLAEKALHQVYFKTDTHWTQRGAYTAYRTLVDKMREWGLCTQPVTEVGFAETSYVGEFGAMLGMTLPAEDTEQITFLQQKARLVNDYDEGRDFIHTIGAEGIQTPCYAYKNNFVSGPRVMLYGDSMFAGWGMPELLAETFPEFYYVWDGNIRESLLNTVSPDVVVYEMGERYLNVFPSRNADFLRPMAVDTELPEIPERPAQTADYWIGVQGVCIDTCNGNPVGESETILVIADAQQIELVGWAADFNALKPLSTLYLQIGEHVVQCDYGIERTSVSDHYGNPDLTDTGFTVVFPASYLQENQTGVMRFIQISADGASRYEPVERRISLPPVPLAEHDAQMLEAHWEGSEVVFTMQNTSGAVWTEKELIRAGIFSNGNDTGLRGYLQPETAVQPGETAVFRISLAGREELFSTELEAVMLQETVCYFEERGKIGAPDR